MRTGVQHSAAFAWVRVLPIGKRWNVVAVAQHRIVSMNVRPAVSTEGSRER